MGVHSITNYIDGIDGMMPPLLNLIMLMYIYVPLITKAMCALPTPICGGLDGGGGPEFGIQNSAYS